MTAFPVVLALFALSLALLGDVDSSATIFAVATVMSVVAFLIEATKP